MTRGLTRRGFMVGCSAAVAGLAGARFNTLAFGAEPATGDILVVIFLRGGMDGLSVVVPLTDPDRGLYEAARPDLVVPLSGAGAALDLDGRFGLNPAAAPLYGLYQDGRAAFVEAVGMSEVLNKSHFDCMEFIELGTPGVKSTTSGWLTRHLQTVPGGGGASMASLAVGDLQPASLLASGATVNLADPSSFSIDNGPWLWRNAQRSALRGIYSGASSWLHDAGVATLDAMDIIQLNVSPDYTPEGGALYPEGELGDHLQLLAQVVKLGLGLEVATLDLGGWDTHEAEGPGPGGYFATLLGELSAGLEAFYTDLDVGGHTSRLTVVAQSEFGRELRQNPDGGTEHGYGNLMLLLGGNVIGGVHGDWPGLATEQLVDGSDLAVTTDYRRVLTEVLVRRTGNAAIDVVFPGYTGYAPLGVVGGTDIPLRDVFSDDFELGDPRRWSKVVGSP